jgi:hypothetical protein
MMYGATAQRRNGATVQRYDYSFLNGLLFKFSKKYISEFDSLTFALKTD